MKPQPIVRPPVSQEGQERRKREYLLDRLLQSRNILLSDQITRELAEDVLAMLLLLEQEDSKSIINIYINSPGGEVDAGFAIYDMARFIEAPVRCVSAGLVASAAVIVLLAADKKNRLSLPNSRFLLHQPSAGVRGSTADIEIEANEILRVRERINSLISSETGQPIEKVMNDTRRNFWMDVAQAKKYGLIAKAIAKRADLKD